MHPNHMNSNTYGTRFVPGLPPPGGLYIPMMAFHPPGQPPPRLPNMSVLPAVTQLPPNARVLAPHFGMEVQMNTLTYYDFLVVLDFEATCEAKEKGPRMNEWPEIIQFPALLVDVRARVVIDSFTRFVRPLLNPILSDFCKDLTGITQAQIDSAHTFTTVFKKFEKWMKNHGLSNEAFSKRTFAIVVDAPFDMGRFLYKQCLISNMPFPTYARRYVNLRHTYQRMFKSTWTSLSNVVEELGWKFEGRQHNGIDDARNIAKILIYMMHQGGVITKTEAIVLDKETQLQIQEDIANKRQGRGRGFDLPTVRPIIGNERRCLMTSGTVITYPPEPDPTDFLFPHEAKNVSIDGRNKENGRVRGTNSSSSQGSNRVVAQTYSSVVRSSRRGGVEE